MSHLGRSEDDEGVDSDNNMEDVENDDLSVSDDEPKSRGQVRRKGSHFNSIPQTNLASKVSDSQSIILSKNGLSDGKSYPNVSNFLKK